MMIAKEMWDFREALIGEGIVFSYSGYITEEVLFGIGNTLKKKLALENTDKRVARGVFSVFVEQVQNVIRYSTGNRTEDESPNTEEGTLRQGIITIGRKNDRYFVACGNRVPSDDVEHLRRDLTRIQGMDQASLKSLYKEILKGETPDGGKDVGVGFVEIARRASKGFDFDFYATDSAYSFFAIKAYI